MAELSTEIRIFLSSTFIDLRDLRHEIAESPREVFGAKLIIMETFGSDEAPPDIASVRKVRECDIFVGIYARRYGTVDSVSGKSITELEFDEAERSVSAGNIVGILLYLLDDKAPWPRRYCDTDPVAIEKLSQLKNRARQHTITTFGNPKRLHLLVVRDILTKIRSRLSVVPPQLRRFTLPDVRRLQRPIGMEFLTSADRDHLHGRNEKVKELLGSIDRNVITLLLGNSGTGKTSIIHAGLIPRAIGSGWLPVYTRPLGLPRSDVATLLAESIFEGPSSYRGSLAPLVEQVAVCTKPRRLLLIIDQFEDILTAREREESNRLVADLRIIRHLDDSAIRVLVSYRADLEARLGEFWQFISGSAEGLARVYVSGINELEAWAAIQSACGDLSIRLELPDAEKLQLRKGLSSFSTRHGGEGVYPPYIQMLVDHMWQTTQTTSHAYRLADYLAAGGIEGITGGYLSRQLTYAQDTTGHIRAVLVSLVRSYGVKAQKPLQEIASDVGISQPECEILVERLIDLRFVRHIGNQYEIAHDFLAQEISLRLVDAEEREFKRFRELLSSKAAAFTTTRSLLTVEELLVLFNHKERVLPSDSELRLILASWATGSAPGLYWIMNAPSAAITELVRAEEREGELEDEDRAMLALLRRKISNTPLRAREWQLFRKYQLGIELSGLLSRHASECPDSVVLFALRSRHRNVRAAAISALAEKVASGQRRLISLLGRSSSPLKRTPYELLALRTDLTLPVKASSDGAPRALQEFALLQRVAQAEGAKETRAAFKALKRFRPKARSLLFAKGTLMLRTNGIQSILRKLTHTGGTKAAILLSSVGKDLTDTEFQALLETYRQWNQKEADHLEVQSRRVRAFYEDKATALATTIQRATSGRNLKFLRQMFRRITLTPSAQHYVIALMTFSRTSDVLGIIRKIEQAKYDIRYWFHLGVAHAIERRMTELDGGLPNFLVRRLAKRAFWEDPRAERSRFARKDLLPIRTQDNRALYLRLVAHAAIGAARMANADLLKKLAQHEFRLIARAAAIRLTKLAGDDGLRILQSAIPDAIEHGKAESLGLALRDAEIYKFGVAELW